MKSYLVSYSWVSDDGRKGDGMINMFYSKHPAYDDLTETRRKISSILLNDHDLLVLADDIVILNIIKMRKS